MEKIKKYALWLAGIWVAQALIMITIRQVSKFSPGVGEWLDDPGRKIGL